MREKVILLCTVLCTAVLTLILSESYRYLSSYNTVPSLDEMIFVKQLRLKLGLKSDAIISVFPSHAFRTFLLGDNYKSTDIDTDSTNSAYLFYSAGVWYLMFDYEFYKRLSNDDRRLVVAHEFWHAYRYEEKGIKIKDLSLDEALQEEGRGDIFALVYVKPETIIQFLNAYCEDQKEREFRVANIRKYLIINN